MLPLQNNDLRLVLIDVTFTPLADYTRGTLAADLERDVGNSMYNSKEKLAARIRTDDKINGFVIQFKFKDEASGTVTTEIAGFALYQDSKLTDMYTFFKGKGNFLFNRITGYFKQQMGWENIEVLYDDNNRNMKEFFDKAIEKPWDPLKNVIKG
jgi:myo-inositol-hexaphosphate 3-phosphohydrolase